MSTYTNVRDQVVGSTISTLQQALINAGIKVVVNGIYDAATRAGVIQYQRLVGLVQDGIAGPKTMAALRHGAADHRYLTEADLQAAAARLRVPLAVVKAVNEVESQGPGFLASGRPVILFERHVFYDRLVAHGIDVMPLKERFPSYVTTQRGGYAGGEKEWLRLESAMRIHRESALEATSWGSFQVMGYYWQRLGYDTLDAFVEAMKTSEAAHLDAFIGYVTVIAPACLKALQSQAWAAFARAYNGPAYADNLYDTKLARAYSRYLADTKLAA